MIIIEKYLNNQLKKDFIKQMNKPMEYTKMI